MGTGAKMKDMQLKKNEEFIIVNLIKRGLSKQTNVQFDEYILSSVDAFCQNKREIILYLHFLNEGANDNIRNLLLHPIDNNDHNRADDDHTNLFYTELLTLFPNAESLIVHTG